MRAHIVLIVTVVAGCGAQRAIRRATATALSCSASEVEITYVDDVSATAECHSMAADLSSDGDEWVVRETHSTQCGGTGEDRSPRPAM